MLLRNIGKNWLFENSRTALCRVILLSVMGWWLQKPKCGEAIFYFRRCSWQILRQKAPTLVLTRNSSYDRILWCWKDRTKQLHVLRFSWRTCDALGLLQLPLVPLSLQVTVQNKYLFMPCHAFPAVEQNCFILQVTSEKWVDQENLGGSGELVVLAQGYSKHIPRAFVKGGNVSVLIEYSFRSYDGVNTPKSERWYQANSWRSCPDQD